MKNVTPTLMTFLDTATQMCVCDLLTITLNDGTSLYLSNADVNVTWAGQVYSSGSGNITFERSKTSCKIGVEVAEMDLSLYANSGATIEGVPALQFIRNAGLDGALVRVDRLFLSTWAAPVGIVNNFVGRASNLDVTRSSAKVVVKSPMSLMDLQLPKNQYQPTCLHSLYDSGCTLNRASYAVTGTVGAGSTLMQINSTLSNPASWFTQGYIQFTSGVNAGTRRTVLAFSGGSFSLAMPLLNAPGVGDAFTAYPGCDHTSPTCTAKFSNMANFRGFEFVPQPINAL